MKNDTLFPNPEQTAKDLFKPQADNAPKGMTLGRLMAFFLGLWGVCVLFILSVIGVVGYVAYHFLSKVW